MILKFINAFLMGIAFVSILVFLFFIGLKINYFDFFGIQEYFNIIFVDNLNFSLYALVSFILGYIMLYSAYAKILIKLYLVAIFLSAASIYEPIGFQVGAELFMQKNKQIKLGSTVFGADILYSGRDKIYLYRSDLDKMITLQKAEVTILAL